MSAAAPIVWRHDGVVVATGRWIEGDSATGGLFAGATTAGEPVRSWLAPAARVAGRSFEVAR